MAPLSLQLLGDFEARVGPRRLRLPRKARALLAYLALAGDPLASRTRLVILLWGDGDERDARNNLRQVLFRVRRSLGAGGAALIVDADTVGLDPALVDVDVRRFEQLAEARSEAALEQAAELYRGDLLEGLDVGEAPFEEWLRDERERVRERSIDLHTRLLALQLERSRLDSVIRTALRLLALDPLQEEVHRALMRAYAGVGRRTAALRQYQLCLDTLQRELQAEPEPETRHLYLKILRGPEPDGVVARTAASQRTAPAHGRGDAALPVGRDVELRTLRDVMTLAAGGDGRVVVIRGEAGVGKSTLAQQLVGDAARSGWLVLEGRGHETERDLPFALWVGALRSTEVLSDDGLLGRLGPAWRHALATLFPEVARDRGGRAWRRTEDRLRLYEALSHLVRALATTRPILVVLEDLHRADTTSQRCLGFLGRRLGHVRACIVATARVEDGDTTVLDAVLAELRSAARLTGVQLGPMSRPATIELVARLAPHRAGSAELVERIWQMSEGNPLVVVEALRRLAEHRATADGADLRLPEGVRQLILSRTAQLGPAAQLMLSAAGVVGRNLEFALLRDVAGLKDDDAADVLEELVRCRLLQQGPDGLAFTHDRVREAVLSALLPPRRRLLHAAVARALEVRHAGDLDEHVATLALHCRGGELWPDAVQYLRHASLVAAARGAFREAASLLEEALELITRLPPGRARTEPAIDTRLELADRAMVLGDFPRVEQSVLEALALAEVPADEGRVAFAQAILAHHDLNTANLERGLRFAEEALAIAARRADWLVEARAAFSIGTIRAARAEHQAAIDAFQHTIRAAGDDPLTMLTIGLGLCHPAARSWMALSLAELGRFDEAVALAQEGVERADTARNIFGMAWTRLMAGRVYLLRGELDHAMTALVASRELIDRYELGLIRRLAVIALAQAHLLAGAARVALEHARQGPRVWANALLAESAALLADGRTDEAEAAATAALAMSRCGSQRGNEATALGLLGDVHARRPGAMAQARACYDQALAITVSLGLRPRQAHQHRGLAQLLAGAGDAAGAAPHRADAVRLYREMGMARWIEPERWRATAR